MNEKRWFIFNRDHHLGPFETDEIRARLHRGEISMESQLWCEGMAGWSAFKNIDFFHRDAVAPAPEEPQWKRSLAEANQHLNEIEPDRQEKILKAMPAPLAEEVIEVEEEVVEVEALVEEVFEEEDELPPPLPPLPIEEEAEDEIEEDLEEEEAPLDFPMTEHGENIEAESEDTGEFDVQEMTRENVSQEASEEMSEAESPHPVRWWSGMSLLVVSLIVLIWVLWPKKIAAPFMELSDAQRSVLTHFAKNAPDKNWMFKFYVDREKGKVYLAGNKSDEAKLTVRFTGVEKRLLTVDRSEFVSEIELSDYFGASKDLTLISGTEINQGEYQVEIHGQGVGWKPKLMQKLKTWPVFKDMTFIKNYSPEVIYRSQFLVFSGSPKQFEETLKSYNQAIENKRVQPLKDQLQRILAMKAFLDGVRALFLDYMNRISKGSSISGFERKYNLEIGPALSEMVMDNNRLSIEKMNLDKEQSRQYETLMRMGKNLGGIAADIVSKTRRYPKLKNADKEYLMAFFEKKLNRLEEQFNTQIQQIDNSIKAYTR